MLLLDVGNVDADLVQWTLADLTFSDGGSATGAFLVDTDLLGTPEALLDYDISVSGGDSDAFPPFHWTAENSEGELSRHGLSLRSLLADRPSARSWRRFELSTLTIAEGDNRVPLFWTTDHGAFAVERYNLAEGNGPLRVAFGKLVDTPIPHTTAVPPLEAQPWCIASSLFQATISALVDACRRRAMSVEYAMTKGP